ncbi:MAG: DnaJ domain-containing protein [Magnetospirillum sp.]|jgi:DnaJ-domain-containing protein 1|nr:DnaJ domain-containing protein [Magnetospirillum sp.]
MGLFYLLIGCGVAFLLWLLLRTLADAPPKKIIAGAKIAGAGVGILGALFLLVTGRLWSVLALGSAFAPALMRFFKSWQIGQGGTAQTETDDSSVETRLLRMTLDHATGAMDGLVREGKMRGRKLSELGLDALLDLLAEARLDDPDSAPLLEAFLDRAAPDWRSHGGAASGEAPPASPARGGMTRSEAARLLGVAEDADAATIKAAHRRLMMKVHPDHGGTDELAARLNDAKRVLLGD